MKTSETTKTGKAIKERLEYLREQLNAECISYDELHELQSLAAHIEPGDVQLLEAAGVPETITYTTTRAVLKVTGNLWSGPECEHEYPLKDNAHPATLAEAKRIAGDFESLDSAEIVTTEREVTEKTKITKLT